MRPGLPSVCCNTSKQLKKQHCVVQIAPSVIWILLQREDGLSLSLKLFPFYTDLNRSCSFVSVRLSHVFIFVPNNSFVRRHRRVPPQQRRMWPRVPEHGGQLRVQLQEGLQAADQREDLPRWAALFLVSLEQVSSRLWPPQGRYGHFHVVLQPAAETSHQLQTQTPACLPVVLNGRGGKSSSLCSALKKRHRSLC